MIYLRRSGDALYRGVIDEAVVDLQEVGKRQERCAGRDLRACQTCINVVPIGRRCEANIPISDCGKNAPNLKNTKYDKRENGGCFPWFYIYSPSTEQFKVRLCVNSGS